MDDTPQQQRQTDTEYASVDELTVRRDEAGELLPVDKETPMFGVVQVKPMAYGAVERHFGDAGEVAQVESEVIAQVLGEHIVKPDLNDAAGGKLTASWVRENLKPMAPRDLLMAILDASDVDADVAVDDQGNAEVALDDQGNRL